MTKEEEKPIRVFDRRMFTAEGELRPDYEPEEREPPRPPAREAMAPSPPPPVQAEGVGPVPEPPPSSEEGAPEPREPRTAFGALVGWIATNAYAALGLLSDAGGRAQVDLAAAKQMIDWLAVLEQKTRGNLSFEETDFLSRALYELRLAFVEMSRRPAK
jgi:Domain of unknown function (DUF1844)